MAAVEQGKVTARSDRHPSGLDQVCGTCGCLIAVEHVQRHIDWHASTDGAEVTKNGWVV